MARAKDWLNSVWSHAVLFAFLCVLPQATGWLANRGDYSPFSVSPSVSANTFDETHAYAPPARRLYETGRLAAETDNFENRDRLAGIPFIPTALLGALAWALGGLDRAFLAADLFFPPLLFILLFHVTPGAAAKTTRLAIVWLTIIVSFNLLNTFWLGTDAQVAGLDITRTPQPEISFLILMAAVASFAKRRTIVAGVISSAVVYSYDYYAVAWGLALVLIFVLTVSWRMKSLAMQSAACATLMAVLALPFLVATAQGRAQGGQTDLLARVGEFTYRPNWLALFVALLFTGLLAGFGKRLLSKEPIWFVLLALALGAIWGMNIQIVSGFETQAWHFSKRLAIPLFFFVAASALPRASVRPLLILLLATTALRLSWAGWQTAQFERASEPRHALLDWARVHLPANQVIGSTDPEFILLITALTADYTYVPSGLRSLTSTEEIVERFDQLACATGETADQVARMASVPNHLGHSTELLQTLGLSFTGDIPTLEWFVRQYRAYLLRCKPPDKRIDYVILPVKAPWPAGKVLYKNSTYQLVDWRRHAASGE